MDGAFQNQRQRRAGGDGQAHVGRDRTGVMPGSPEGGHGWQRHTGGSFRRAPNRFRQRRRRQDQRNAVEQQRQHQVRKTVGVRQRDHAQVRPVRTQPHAVHNVARIGGQLLAGEGNRARRTGRGGGGLEMAAGEWRCRNRRRFLIRLQRANDRLAAPGAQHGKNELGPVPLRVNQGLLVRR